MNRVLLTEFVRRHRQAEVAEKLGVTQGAISKMLRSDRTIWVVEHPDGRIEAIEERRIGKSAA